MFSIKDPQNITNTPPKKIADFRAYKKHDDYFIGIQEKHKKKRAFWAEYELQLKK